MSIRFDDRVAIVTGADCSPEGVAARWDEITSTEGQTAYASGSEQAIDLLTKAARSLGVEIS